MDKNIYGVITCDVVKSRESDKKIIEYLDKNNSDIDILDNYIADSDILKKYLIAQSVEASLDLYKRDMILTAIKQSRGDEIQVISKDIDEIPKIIRTIRYYFRPLKLRIGVGIGKIEFPDGEIDSSWDLNGEAFFKARDAISFIEHTKDEYSTYFMIDESQNEKTINNMYLLMDLVINKWSDAKWKSIYYYDRYKSYEKASSYLGLTPRAINKNCTTANWNIVKKSEIFISELITQLK